MFWKTNMNIHIMMMTPVPDFIMMKSPIIKWHRATKKWPAKRRVLLPASLTVPMLTKDARKFTVAMR